MNHTARMFQNSGFSRLKYYYLSLILGYLLVPVTFSYMDSSFESQGFDPSRIPIPRETFFMKMMLVAGLSGVIAIVAYSTWNEYLLRRAGLRRPKFDIVFASSHIAVPVFFFVLGWLNIRY